jgi:hypothetical protein
VPLLGLYVRAQALRNQLGQMRMLFDHARDQLGPLGAVISAT